MKTTISTRPNVPSDSTLIAHGKMNDRLDVEDHEQQAEHVIADVGLAPP